MSKPDLDALVDKARSEPDFANALFDNFDDVSERAGFSLNDAEKRVAQERLSSQPSAPMNVDMKQIQQQISDRLQQQSDQVSSLNKESKDLFQATISHAVETFRKITMMNQVMFWMGVSLFFAASVTALFTRNVTSTALFAGLGTVSFIGFFLLGPINKTQAALAHLIQAQIAFMGYYEQLYFLESIALARDSQTGLPDPARLAQASDLLQQRCAQLMELLGTYLAGYGTRERRYTPPPATVPPGPPSTPMSAQQNTGTGK